MKSKIFFSLFVFSAFSGLSLAMAKAGDLNAYPNTGYVYIDYRSAPPDQVDTVINLLVANNIKYIHGEIAWGQVEQVDGVYNWSGLFTMIFLLKWLVMA